jgi:hypothetical protein
MMKPNGSDGSNQKNMSIIHVYCIIENSRLHRSMYCLISLCSTLILVFSSYSGNRDVTVSWVYSVAMFANMKIRITMVHRV